MAKESRSPRRRSFRITILLGLLTLLLGSVLGVLSLATQKVEEVASMPQPEDRKPGVVYLLRGEDAPGARWRRKRNTILRGDPGKVVFTESDLNDWARNQLKVARPQGEKKNEGTEGGAVLTRTEDETEGATGEGEDAAEKDGFAAPGWLKVEIVPTAPNFAFLEGQLQMVTYLEVPALGGRKFVYRVVGYFEKEEDGLVRFVPVEGSVGRAPLGNVPFLGAQINTLIMSLFQNSPEWRDLTDPWKHIESIRVDNGELAVSIR